MAKNRKLQRAERHAQEKAAAATKPPVVEVIPEPPPVVEVVPEPVKEKPARKRHVRPPKQTPAPKPAPLARGTSMSSRLMSMKVAKTVVDFDPQDTKGAAKRVAPPPSV